MSRAPVGPVPRVEIDPFDSVFLADPYAQHDVLRDAGPVFWISKYSIYGMARYAEVSAALMDYRTYCSGRGVGLSDFAQETPWRPPSLLLETDPPIHDRTRGLMKKVVSLTSLREVKPRWKEKAEELAQVLLGRRRFDAISDLADIYPMMVFPDTIGLPLDGRSNLLAYAAATFNAFGPRNALYEQTDKAARAAKEWVAEACRRANLTRDGWGAAVFRAADEGLCSEAEAERLVRSFLSAGIDTTINGIGNMIHAFAKHPGEWQKLRTDRSRLKFAFEETLRWDSTVQTFFRTTTRDTTVAATTIPEGSKVLLFLAAANRDPRKWQNAAEFNIARQTSGHVGFGFGIHQCLGQMIARQEAELVLGALLPYVAGFNIVGPVTRRLNNTLHAIGSLPIEVAPS